MGCMDLYASSYLNSSRGVLELSCLLSSTATVLAHLLTFVRVSSFLGPVESQWLQFFSLK